MNPVTMWHKDLSSGSETCYCEHHGMLVFGSPESEAERTYNEKFSEELSRITKGGDPTAYLGTLRANPVSLIDPIYQNAKRCGIFAFTNEDNHWTFCFPTEKFDIEFGIFSTLAFECICLFGILDCV